MNPVTWGAMIGAILAEVIGTMLLSQTQQFTRVWPTLGMAVSYALAFYLLAVALKEMPVGLAYAMWSGLGVTLIAVIGWVVLKQRLDLPAILGISLILSGVIVMNVFSKTLSH